jgi:predicted PurR-regulated permease PerM
VQLETEERAYQGLSRSKLPSYRTIVLVAAGALVIYLCWQIIAPFITAVSWAFALAVIVRPAYIWLLRKKLPQTLAAMTLVFLTGIAFIGPAGALTTALAKEAAEIVGRAGSEDGIHHLREVIEKSRLNKKPCGGLRRPSRTVTYT